MYVCCLSNSIYWEGIPVWHTKGVRFFLLWFPTLQFSLAFNVFLESICRSNVFFCASAFFCKRSFTLCWFWLSYVSFELYIWFFLLQLTLVAPRAKRYFEISVSFVHPLVNLGIKWVNWEYGVIGKRTSYVEAKKNKFSGASYLCLDVLDSRGGSHG